MPVVGTVVFATGPGTLGWSAWEEGPWHGPSVCPQPALCTDQVRRADWSLALRAPLAFPWQLYSQALGSCWAESPGAHSSWKVSLSLEARGGQHSPALNS